MLKPHHLGCVFLGKSKSRFPNPKTDFCAHVDKLEFNALLYEFLSVKLVSHERTSDECLIVFFNYFLKTT